MSRPERSEAAGYYITYIDRIPQDYIVGVMEGQLDDVGRILASISEEKSRHRYAPEKWSIRQVLGHLNDAERAFAFRALWFGRGFHDPLPGFDQNISVNAARADEYAWASPEAQVRDIQRASVGVWGYSACDRGMRSEDA